MSLKSSKEIREKAYKSLVRPQVEYAAAVWSPWLAKDKTRIERVQHRAARYVCNTYNRYSSVTTMVQSLNWETLQARRLNMRLCMVYKAYYNLAMFPLLQYATPATIHTRGHNLKFINVRDCLWFCNSHNSLRLVLLVITCEYKQINFTLL